MTEKVPKRCVKVGEERANLLSASMLVPVSISEIIATRSMCANPHKQQIPPLRCAPVGMTTYDVNVRDWTPGCMDLYLAGRGGEVGAAWRRKVSTATLR